MYDEEVNKLKELPRIAKLGSFFVGGHSQSLSGLPLTQSRFVKNGPLREVDPNGDFETGQMYVQYYHLAQPRLNLPVLLWHGGGMTGASWENTPDGREGWLHLFLRHGYNTYLSDAVERGRSSWSKYPEIYATEPVFRSKQEAWVNFRLGPEYSMQHAVEYLDTQFPCRHFDIFMKQSVPRWTSNNEAILAAYEQYLKVVGPCVVVAHSQASEFAGRLCQKHPDLFQALVLIEASSAPEAPSEQCDTPTLYVWGDHIAPGSLWQRYRGAIYEFYLKQEAIGKPVEWIDLPELGIKGNSHFMMMDMNNIEVFNIVEAWLGKVLQRKEAG